MSNVACGSAKGAVRDAGGRFPYDRGMTTALKRPSYADIEALPEGVTGEIIAGVLHVSPRPKPPHIHSAGALSAFVGGPFGFGRGGPGGWFIEAEPEIVLDVDPDFCPVVPDLAGWRHATMPQLPEHEQFTIVPDWVCEILSPRTAATDRSEKMPFYARCGISHAWLIDPILRTLEVYRLEGGRWLQLGVWRDDAEVYPEPFEALALPLGALWRGRAPRVEPRG